MTEITVDQILISQKDEIQRLFSDACDIQVARISGNEHYVIMEFEQVIDVLQMLSFVAEFWSAGSYRYKGYEIAKNILEVAKTTSRLLPSHRTKKTDLCDSIMVRSRALMQLFSD